MCNPPFYTSFNELKQSAEQKEQEPFSVSVTNPTSRAKQLYTTHPIPLTYHPVLTCMKTCTGAAVEMVTRGGEVAFVKQMIDESLELRDRIQWYTSMLGKLSSINVLVETLIKHGITNFAVTEFEQGSKTKRWALAWSWGDRRPAMVSHFLPPFTHSVLVFCAALSNRWSRVLHVESPAARRVFYLGLQITHLHYHPEHLLTQALLR